MDGNAVWKWLKVKQDPRRCKRVNVVYSDKDIRWFHPDDEEEIINFVNLQLNIR